MSFETFRVENAATMTDSELADEVRSWSTSELITTLAGLIAMDVATPLVLVAMHADDEGELAAAFTELRETVMHRDTARTLACVKQVLDERLPIPSR